jgi:acetyl-CoA carboxylase carboxyltransferase component
MRALVAGLEELEDQLLAGGGARKIEKQHREGKLTARERIARLIDPGTYFLEIGLLIAHDRYDGQAPSAGVVTGLAHIEGRPSVIVANDATVKAGAWWPETIQKVLRAQEIAMRNRLPIVYLVDSAGVNLPYQDGIFPGQHGAARIFYYNSLMRRRLHVPQIAAVMHRRRRVSARAIRRHHHGGRHQFHGARRPEPGERSRRPGGGRRISGRRGAAHARQRGGALRCQGRRAVPGNDP